MLDEFFHANFTSLRDPTIMISRMKIFLLESPFLLVISFMLVLINGWFVFDFTSVEISHDLWQAKS